MAIQYPKNTHITLPSVEQWGTNANILRDPPKSIHTRRIDKVGQNTDITELVDGSGDRACEGINYYARGVNPMVSVSYSNNSNNAGISGNPTSTSNQTQAYLPYTIMQGGAFRPPVRNPRDLLPLSRLPRVWFSAEANPSITDYSKTKQQPNDFRAVKNEEDIVRVHDIRPNKSANISSKLVEHFKMANAINDRHINVGATAGYQSRDITSFTRDHVDKGKGINNDYTSAYAQSAATRDMSHNLDNISIDQKQYIQNYLAHEGHTNPSMAISQGLENLSIDQKRYIQNYLAHEGHTNPSMNISQGLDNISIDQKRYIQNYLAHEGHTNLSMAISQGLDNLSIDQKRYIHDLLQAEQNSNKSRDIHAKSIDQLYDNGRMTVKDNMMQYESLAGINPGYTFLGEMAQPVLEETNLPQHQRTTQISDSRIHHRVAHDTEPALQRHTPHINVTANITKIEDINSMTLSSRQAKLAPTLQKGGFHNVGNKPTFERKDQIDLMAGRESDKDKLRKSVNQQFSRYDH
jgi:hypothetical protein